MKPSEALLLNRNAIFKIVIENNAKNPRVFGSTLHGDDTDVSDLDLLVDSTQKTTLFDMARMQRDLQKLLCRKVDVMTPGDLPDSFREEVVKEARPI